MVSDVLAAGCRWLMVREKDLDTAALGDLAKEIVDQAKECDGYVVVNGDLQAAQYAVAAGVHLQNATQVRLARERLGAGALVGVSTHSLEEARAAALAGADYVTMSPVFLTGSKPGYGPALGIDGLAAICRQLSLPVVALAGITPATAPSCLDAGAAAVAVMGAVMRSEMPAATVHDFLQSISCRDQVS